MDYKTVDVIMSAKNLAHDPAFDAVNILIEPTPNFNGCPLGLYYPGTGTIVLPPDATEGVLLHELGHRFGHFHFEDLSEKYAESFRAKHQNGVALLYAGSNFGRLSKFGAVFEEGEKGVVQLTLSQQLDINRLREFKDQFNLYSQGEPLPRFYYGDGESPWVRIEFTKGVDWLVIIGSVLAGTILAGAGAIGYAVYKTAKDTPWIIPVTIAGAGAFFLVRAMLKQSKVMAR